MQSSRRQRPPAMQSEPLMGGPAPSMGFRRFLCCCYARYMSAAWLRIARPIVAKGSNLEATDWSPTADPGLPRHGGESFRRAAPIGCLDHLPAGISNQKND